MSTSSAPATAVPARPTGMRRNLIVLVILVIASLAVLPWNLSALSSWDGFVAACERMGGYLSAFGAPDLSAAMLSRCFWLAIETVAVATLGTGLGLVIAYPIALLSSRCVVVGDDPSSGPGGALRRTGMELARFVLDALRGIPDFLWAILLVPFTGINATTGVLAIAVSVGGIYGKVLSEQWDNVDPLNYQALRSTGASRLQMFLYGVQPLAARSMQSFVLMRFECAVRNASVIGVVGGGGLGAALWDEYTDSNWARVVTVLLSLLLVTTVTDLGANLVRRQLWVDPNHPQAAVSTTPRQTAAKRWTVAALVAAMLAGAVIALWHQLVSAANELQRIEWDFIADFVGGLMIPDLSTDTLLSVARHSLVPLAIGVLATVIGMLGAALLSYPASVAFQLEAHRFTGERLRPIDRLGRWSKVIAAKTIALVLRGVPEVGWVVILAVFFQTGITPCVLAVGLHSAGVLHRVYTETLDNVPYPRLERISSGCRSQIFLYGAMPRALADWRTYTFFQFEVNMRAGIALGIVGAGGLGHMFDFNLDWRQFGTASSFLWAMVLLTVVIDRISRRLQMRRLRC